MRCDPASACWKSHVTGTLVAGIWATSDAISVDRMVK